MAVKIRRAESSCIEKIAPLFDASRGFYGQPSNLPESRDFLAERLSHNESVIFYAQDEFGEALGFVQLYPFFPQSPRDEPGFSTISMRPMGQEGEESAQLY